MGDWLVAGASLAWALDHILIGHIAHSDALVIACVKGLVAGVVDFAIFARYEGGHGLPLGAAGAGLAIGLGQARVTPVLVFAFLLAASGIVLLTVDFEGDQGPGSRQKWGDLSSLS